MAKNHLEGAPLEAWVADELSHCGENSGVGRHAPVSDAKPLRPPAPLKGPLLLCKAAFFKIRRVRLGLTLLLSTEWCSGARDA